MNTKSSAVVCLAVICGIATVTALVLGFNSWCGNPSASLAVATGRGGDSLNPVRPAWQTRIAPAYWHERLLPVQLEQFQTPKGYVVVVQHPVAPKQWIQAKGGTLPPTASPMPGVKVIKHYSAAALKRME